MDNKKHIHTELTKLKKTAYERDLESHLLGLSNLFTEWQKGNISARRLSTEIHKFYRGPASKLFKFYSRSNLDIVVSEAVVNGVLSEEEISVEVIEKLRWIIDNIRKSQKVNNIDLV